MSCGWCGHGYCRHGYCHHCGHYYGHGYGAPPFWAGYGPGYGPRRRIRGALDEEDLVAYLEDLEEEIGRVREELAGLRRRRPAEETEGG